MSIERFPGKARGRSRAVAHAGIVYAVATAADPDASLGEQTRRTLEALDGALEEAGSDRGRILSATVYVTDIARKDEMDAVWCEWIGAEEAWPQRACIEVGLAADTLVEIVVTAARR